MKYKVAGTKANFTSGEINLSEEQYKARAHALEPMGKGKYLILSPVEFKAGEVVEVEAGIPKDMLGCLEEVDESAKRPRKPKAEGEE